MKKVLAPIAYVAVIGFIITVSLAVGIWSLSKWTVEREYLTLEERVRFAVIYPTLPTPEKKFAFAKNQLTMLTPPLIDFTRSQAADCARLYADFEMNINKANAITANYDLAGSSFELETVSASDLDRIDLYTRTGFELLAQYNTCASR